MKDPYQGLTERQVSVRRYFTPTPTVPHPPGIIASAVIGVFLLFAGLAGSPFLAVLGALVAVVAAAKAVPVIVKYRQQYALAEPKPSDHQMDLWLAEAVEPCKKDGLHRLDLVDSDQLDPESALPVVGFPESSNLTLALARGKDGLIRASYYDILIVYLTKWHLSTYQCVLEMETGDFVSDQTREFHYRDVVSVATSSDRWRMKLPSDHSKPRASRDSEQPPVEVTTRQWFRLRVSSDEIALLVGLFNLGTYGDGSAVDIALRQIRGRLREYTRLHEPDRGAFDDLPAGRRPAEGPREQRTWPQKREERG